MIHDIVQLSNDLSGLTGGHIISAVPLTKIFTVTSDSSNRPQWVCAYEIMVGAQQKYNIVVFYNPHNMYNSNC